MRPNSSPFEQIKELCIASSSNNVMQEKELFENESELIYDAITNFHQKVKTMTLESIVLLWSHHLTNDRICGERNLFLMIELLESGFLPLVRNKDPITLLDFSTQKHDAILDAIRSHQAWRIEKQENIVTLYVDFATWLSKASYGLISMPIDLDKTVTAKRKLPFGQYIQLLMHLSLRERICAKLFYLGGARALEEILNLKIQDIDFEKNQIRFGDIDIYYSRHVLSDLREYIEGRKKGFVFLNKFGERVNQTVPYRALKIAAAKLNFPPTFAFKDLVQEV